MASFMTDKFWNLAVICLLLSSVGCRLNREIRVAPNRSHEEIVRVFELQELPTVEVLQEEPPERLVNLQSIDSINHADPLDLRYGEIFIAGSPVVHPITQVMTDQFNRDGYIGKIHLSQSSSESGIDQFCRGDEIDIVNVARPMTSAESSLCLANGRELYAFLIGYDQIGFVVHEDNFWLQELDSEQLSVLFNAERWSDLDSIYPKRKINHYYPDQSNPVFDLMSDYLFEIDDTILLDDPDAFYFPYETDLLRDLTLDPGGFGFASNAHITARDGIGLNIIPLDGAVPSDRGYYPLRRELYIVTDVETLQSKPHVATFVAYYLNGVGKQLHALGFANIPNGMGNFERTKFVKLIESLESNEDVLRMMTLESEIE